METGEMLFLTMVVAAFVAFGATLAFVTTGKG